MRLVTPTTRTLRTARRLARPAALAALCGALAGCASSGSGSAAAPASAPATEGSTRAVVRSSSPTMPDVELFRDRRAVRTRVQAPPATVWGALPAAFASLGLEGAPLAGRERTLIAQPRLRRALSRIPLSRYLECGRTATGDASADVHSIQLAVTTAVLPDGEASTVATNVSATATPVESSTAPTECSSTGVLESRINELLAANLR